MSVDVAIEQGIVHESARKDALDFRFKKNPWFTSSKDAAVDEDPDKEPDEEPDEESDEESEAPPRPAQSASTLPTSPPREAEKRKAPEFTVLQSLVQSSLKRIKSENPPTPDEVNKMLQEITAQMIALREAVRRVDYRAGTDSVVDDLEKLGKALDASSKIHRERSEAMWTMDGNQDFAKFSEEKGLLLEVLEEQYGPYGLSRVLGSCFIK